MESDKGGDGWLSNMVPSLWGWWSMLAVGLDLSCSGQLDPHHGASCVARLCHRSCAPRASQAQAFQGTQVGAERLTMA